MRFDHRQKSLSEIIQRVIFVVLTLCLTITLSAGNACEVFADDIREIDGLTAGVASVLAHGSSSDQEEDPMAAAGEVTEKKRQQKDASKYDVSENRVSEDTALENTVSDNATEADEESETDSDKNEKEEIPGYDTDKLVMANVNDSVNVREKPDEESELAGKLYKDCAGEILQKKDDWTRIRSGNLTGWVKNDYLYFGDEAVQLAKQTGRMTAKVEADTLRIREKADENAKVYGLLAGGETIEALEESDGWVKVAYSDDTEGYVSAEYVTLDYEIDEGETMEEIKARKEKEEEKARKEEEKRKQVEASRTTVTTTTNTGAVAAATDDVTLLAALIQCEAGWECYEGQLAVGAVVVNRAKGRYGSIYNAVYAPGQFGPAASGKVALTVAVGPGPVAMKAAQDAISGVSNVGTATHFRNIRSGYAGIVIGNHVFW